MLTEHQGKGTYDYSCKYADCFYCEKFGLKPIVKKEPQIKSFKYWSVTEEDLLIKMLHLPPKRILKVFPNRTLMSVSCKKQAIIKKLLTTL